MSIIKKIFEFVVDNKDAIKDVKDTEKAIKGATDETQKLNKETKKTPKLLKLFKNGIKGIGTALKAAGIGIVIALFAKFTEALMKNQKVVDAFNVVMEVLSRVMNDFVSFLIDSSEPISKFFTEAFENPKKLISDLGDSIKKNLIERFDSFVDTLGLAGKALKQVFEGDFAGAWNTAKEAGKEVVDVYTGVDNSYDKIGKTLKETGLAIANYAKETYDAADAQVELRKNAKLAEAQIELSILQSQKEVEQLRQVRDNTELTIEARIKANDKIALKLQEQGKEEKKLANIRLATAEADLANNKDNVDLQIAVKNAKSKVADVEERIAGFASEQLLNEQSLREERRTNLQELRKIGKSKEELSKAELETTLENQRLLIERTVENEDEKNELLLKAAMQYNQGVQALEDESLAKLQEIRDKYIDEDNIGLSQVEIFEREREVQREAYVKELEALEEFEEEKAALLAKFDKDTVKKKVDVENKQAQATKDAKNKEIQAYLGATSAIVQSLGQGSIAAKGFAIAESAFNTYLAITKTLSAFAGVPVPGYAIAQAVATGVFGLLQVGKIASTDPTTGAGPASSGGVRGAGNTISTGPRFDTVGDSEGVRNAQNEESRDNTPRETYVVSGKVTNQQDLDRNKQNNSRFV